MPEPGDEDLLERAKRLDEEACAIRERLDLHARLESLGVPVEVGAAGLGVIDRRDLDITTTCATLDDQTLDRIAQLGAALARHEDVRQVVIRDDTGRWNTDPRYPDGCYLGLEVMSPVGELWTADLWFVDHPERQPDLAHLRRFAPLMTDESRARILALKRATRARGRGAENGAVPGYLIYEAVTQGGVCSETELREWVNRRGTASETSGEGGDEP